MSQTPRSKSWVLAAIVAAVAILIYAPTWRHGFTCLDDDDLVLDRQAEFGRGSSLYEVFGQSYFGGKSTSYYRPVVNLSFALDAQWSGAEPLGYHLTNTALHSIVCVLLFALLRRLALGDFQALAAALLFAVHPVHVASVAWIPGRNDVLMTGFALGACLLLIREQDRPGWVNKSLHLLCLVLALLSKETALCLPILLAVLLWARGGWRELLSRRRLWLGWAGAFAVYLAARLLVIAFAYQDVIDRLALAARRWPVPLADLGKLLLPVRLQVLASPQDVHVWPGVVAMAALAVVLWRVPAMRSRRAVFALGCVVVPLLAGLVGAKMVVLENRLYLAGVGVAILVGEALGAAARKWPRRVRASGAVVAGVLALFGIMAVRHSTDYADRLRFARAAVVASPHSGIAVNLMRRNALAGARRFSPPAPRPTRALSPSARPTSTAP